MIGYIKQICMDRYTCKHVCMSIRLSLLRNILSTAPGCCFYSFPSEGSTTIALMDPVMDKIMYTTILRLGRPPRRTCWSPLRTTAAHTTMTWGSIQEPPTPLLLLGSRPSLPLQVLYVCMYVCMYVCIYVWKEWYVMYVCFCVRNGR